MTLRTRWTPAEEARCLKRYGKVKATNQRGLRNSMYWVAV
jgi:hypothetical protein